MMARSEGPGVSSSTSRDGELDRLISERDWTDTSLGPAMSGHKSHKSYPRK